MDLIVEPWLDVFLELNNRSYEICNLILDWSFIDFILWWNPQNVFKSSFENAYYAELQYYVLQLRSPQIYTGVILILVDVAISLKTSDDLHWNIAHWRNIVVYAS